ncbi:MAG: TonB-dependent receptor [Ginsengibacter sp.]|jgi:hypothetical protein
MQFKKLLPLLIVAILAPFFMNAQVTTSSISGFVKSISGEPLESATVTAIHQPSGTKYVTLSKKDGNYTLPNARVGGPYSVTVDYVGFKPQTIENITLSLGEPSIVDVILSTNESVLSEITISGVGRPTVAKTGASTVFNNKQIAALPSISRSISDITRLTPQANGNSFAGRDGRYNNLQVDGANLNNNFGLSTDPLPGGGASPISIEAFDEISVNIAPFDVRQSGFTGAGLNVITKSGTNTLHGSAYGYYRDQDLTGNRAGKTELTRTPSKNKSYGATLGGPIIKDKLFFFVNAEWEDASTPNPNTWIPKGSTATGRESFAPIDSLNKFRTHLKTKYNYEAGAYDNRPNFVNENRKFLAKLDWNISNKHKLVLKYSDLKASDQSPLNASSVPNGGGFRITDFSVNPAVVGGSNSRLPNSRNGNQSIAFTNSDYATDHVVQSGTIELNSNFTSKISNQLLLSYTHITDTRTSPGGIFPTIEIFNADGSVDGVSKGSNYMSAGTDPFTRNNDIVNNIAAITNNFSYFAGKHTLTAGVNYEYQKVGNAFMAGSEGYFVYNTLNEFINDKPPAFYAYTYSLVPGQPKVFSADLKIGQLGIYAQDEFNINSNFKLTYGLRVDLPTYLDKPIENTAITALKFPNEKGELTSYNTGAWPKAAPLFSPRAGFRWKVPQEKGLTIRGGAGVFTGKIPFVFLTNMPSNSGVYQNGAAFTKASDLASIKFDPNPDAYISKFPSTVTAEAPRSFVMIDPEFKFPQVFRTNLGVDKQLGNGFMATIDVLYTKDLNAVKMRNANLKDPSNKLNGVDNRPFYPSGADKVYPNLTEAIVLENTKKGYSFSSTAQISKGFSKGFFGSIAYTYTLATEISPNPGSRANSAWQSIQNVGTPNSEELYLSSYAIPHRVVGNISYKLEYAKNLATTISLYYQGSAQGNYSYIIGGDLNKDGNNASDLMYIYKKGTDVPFVTNGAYSIAQQQAAYDQFVSSSPYLSTRKGNYAERNSALTPWYNRIDARLLQDIFVKIGNTKHTIQLSADVINLPNLISSNWGLRDYYTLNNPLRLKTVDALGNPTFTWSEVTVNGAKKLVDNAFEKNNSFSTTYQVQFGVRYLF